MLKSIKRLQLQRRGLACTKKRLRQSESRFLRRLQSSGLVKALIFAGFYAGFIALLSLSADNAPLFSESTVRGSVVGGLILLAAILQLYANHPNSFSRNPRTLLVFGAMLLQLCLIPLFAYLVSQPAYVAKNGLELEFFFLATPYALAPMALSVLLGRRQAIFTTVFTSLLGCLLVNQTILFHYLIVSLMCGMAAVYTTHELRKRSRLLRAGVYVGVTVVALALSLNSGSDLLSFQGSESESINWRLIFVQCLVGISSGVLSASLVGGFLPLLESLFRLTTNITWIELTDLNHPLLKRMTIEAPGTYHHSLVVANLAASAAETVNANATMCRACSYFHDIGKLVKPEYFIENVNPEQNPHDDLTPYMSALVITAHVKEGISMALKNRLASEIIDIIQEHHGTTLVYFFYRRALGAQEEMRERVEAGEANEEDIPEVKEESFRYAGPIPRTKESAIIMLADSVESASRSLQKVTMQKIEQVIDEITQARIRDGQLDDCDLTLKDINQIKKSFFVTLRSMMHSRIRYPVDNGQKGDKATKRLTRDKTREHTFKVIDAA